MPARDVQTLNDWLAQRKWLMWERGLLPYWQELKEICDATSAASPLGTGDLVNDFAPDIIVLGDLCGEETNTGALRAVPALVR